MERNLVFSEFGSKPDESLRLMLFDLNVSGHHPGYIQHLVKYWTENGIPGNLDVLVSPNFLKLHSDIVDLADPDKHRTKFVAISPEEQVSLEGKNFLAKRIILPFKEWEILCKYARDLGTTHCLIMYLDTLMLPVTLGKKFPCPLSAIYFRPISHYSEFPNFEPSLREQLWLWRDKFYQSKIFRGEKLKNLFCLDPLAIPYLEKYQGSVQVSHLPDPVQIYNQSESELNELRESLGIEADRKVFLLFGSLSDRKGIHQLLEAVLMLPADLAEKLCLLLVGPSVSLERTRMENRMAEILQSLPVQIIRCDQFISDPEIQAYFQIADVILAPYQRHVGMSAILVRAAAAQKPVLSSDYGLMGEITRRYELGLTVDSRFPKAIAQGMTQMLRASPKKFGNPDKMKSFAQENAAERFAQVIFDHLLVR